MRVPPWPPPPPHHIIISLDQTTINKIRRPQPHLIRWNKIITHRTKFYIFTNLSKQQHNILAMATTELKSDAIFELLKRFLGTEEGIAVKNKVNLVYQFNISPKVTHPFFSMIVCVCLDCFLFFFWWFSYGFGLQKIGIDEVIYTIDLKKGEVIKGIGFSIKFAFVLLSDWNFDTHTKLHLANK